MQSLLAALLLSLCALTSATAVPAVDLQAARNSSCNGTRSFAEDFDVVFVIDVSQAMDSRSLIQASALIESVLDSLRVESEFAYGNNSSNATLQFLMELPWADFEWSNNSSDINGTSTREFFQLFTANLAGAWNYTDNNSTDFNGTSSREFFELFATNLAGAWNYTDNNSTDFNGTSTREFFELFAANLAGAWNYTDNNSTDFNGTSTREFFELFATNLAGAWNYTDNNSTDFNGTSTREFFELFATNLAGAYWNYTDNNSTDSNGTSTREFFQLFAQSLNLAGNYSGNNSRFGLITVADEAEVVFDLSAAYANSVSLKHSPAHRQANLRSGIDAALKMLAQQGRSAHHLIYVISASSDPSHPHSRLGLNRLRLHSPISDFKRAGGVVAVTDVSPTSGGKPALRNLASPGLYSRGLDSSLDLLVEATCA